MAELARGTLADRPWGRTLGTLAQRVFTGQLTLGADGKRYEIAFLGGAVAGAGSPLASDFAVRIAMTGGLLSSTQVSDIVRRQAAAPHREELELIAETLRLAPEQTLRLRRRVIAQRAARTFSVDRGEFVIDDQITVPVVEGSELDVRGIIFFGARSNFSETRLSAELALFGSWYRLRPEAIADLPQYGFMNEAPDHAVLARMRVGASLGELEQLHEPRMVRAMVYALVSCNACEVDGPVPRAAVPVPAQTADGSSRHQSMRPSAVGNAAFERRNPADLDAPTIRKLDVPESSTLRKVDPPTAPRPQPAADPATELRQRPTRARPLDTVQAATVRELIIQRTPLLKERDHYKMLGVKRDATDGQIRKAYFQLARQLHPDRLAALEVDDDTRDAHKLMAHINTAFGVLSDPARRAEYTNILRRGGEGALREEQARAEELARRILDAEEAFHRGEMLLRRDQHQDAMAEFKRAIDLNPEADYYALLAWTRFCAAPDRMAVAGLTVKDLERAISKAPRSPTARYYLGRVERMLGHDRDALRIFEEVLQVSPHHSEAKAEIRVIEQRLAGIGDKPPSSPVSRKR